MATKKFNPVTPSLRNMTVSDFAEVTKKTPEKSLLAVKKEKAGKIKHSYDVSIPYFFGIGKSKYEALETDSSVDFDTAEFEKNEAESDKALRRASSKKDLFKVDESKDEEAPPLKVVFKKQEKDVTEKSDGENADGKDN